MKFAIQIIIFFLISNFCIAQSDTELDALISQGESFIKSRDLNSAIQEFEKALAIDPVYPLALSGKIEALTLLNEYKEALKLVNESIERMPDYADYYLNRGMILNYKKQYKKAIEDFNRAIELGNSTKQNRIYENRGAAQQKLDKLDEALIDYSKAIELDPSNPTAFIYKGFVNYTLQNYTEAIEDFAQAINIDANNPYAYYNKGMSHFKLNDNNNACIEFHRSCKLGNRNACQMIISYCTEL